MQENLPWLTQGDIFASAPVVDVKLDGSNKARADLVSGPAILLTHGCAMDKPDRHGQPRVERLQFARLRSLNALPIDRQGNLRGTRDRLQPFEALYVGEVPDLGETFILLSDPYYIPAAYFALTFVDYSTDPRAEPNAKYITPQANDSRVGLLDQSQIELLLKKMIAFWARITEQAD